MDVQVAPVPGHQYELEPERPGLRAAMEDYGEEHHEKKPVLTKVKEKVKKIKHTIRKKHGHGDQPQQEHQVGNDDDDVEEDDERIEDDPEVHGSTSIAAHDARAAGGKWSSEVVTEPQLKDFVREFKEDPAAPMSDCSKTEAIRGGEEIGTSPVIQSFEAMTLRDTMEEEKPSEEGSKGSGGTRYGEKLSETAKMAYEKVADARAVVVEKVVQPGTTAAKTAYEKAVETVTQPASATATVESGRGVRTRLAEKLKPGEEDKALSEVISDAIRRRGAAAAEKAGGVGLMGRLRGAATSWVGGRGAPDSNAAASPLSEQERKEMEDLKGRDESPEEIQGQQKKSI